MMQVTKVWWDGEKLMAEPIDPAFVYTTPPAAQRKPLTDEQIGNDPIFRAGVRFAEAAHGITEKGQP
jgi:hypothetical protein